MAKAKPTEEIEEKPVEGTPPSAPPKNQKKMYILLGGVGAILLQAMLLALILYYLFPPTSSMPPIPDLESTEKSGIIITDEPNPTRIPQEATLEVSLGGSLGDKYKIQDFTADDRSVEFEITLFALINKKDATAFGKQVEARQHSIRATILEVLRSSTEQERLSTSLRELRSKIKKRVNEVLDKPYIIDIIVSEIKNPPV